MSRLIKQLLGFGIIGGLCFLIDYFLMIGLTELGNINYLLAAGMSFSISVVVNYILSMRFIFKSKEEINKQKEFVIFVLLSVIGLGLNELLMWVIVEKIGVYYMITKIIVTAIVMVYNFITRKLILEGEK